MNRKFKISCLILAVAMIFMAMPVLAADTIELNGEVLTVEYYFGGSPNRTIEQRTTDFTPEELVEFQEALSTADYDNYEIIIEENFVIKRVYLMHGYSIDFITLNMENTFLFARAGTSFGSARASVKDTSGREVTWAELAVTFYWTGSTVSVLSADVVADPNPPGGGSWSNLTNIRTAGSGTATCTVTGTPTFNYTPANGGSTSSNFPLTVKGDHLGNTW